MQIGLVRDTGCVYVCLVFKITELGGVWFVVLKAAKKKYGNSITTSREACINSWMSGSFT